METKYPYTLFSTVGILFAILLSVIAWDIENILFTFIMSWVIPVCYFLDLNDIKKHDALVSEGEQDG